MGLPPQQFSQGGTGSVLPPVTGVDCTSGSVLVTNDIYLLSPQDYYAASSTRVTYPDPSLWTVTVTASSNRDGTTIFPQPAQPVKTDANSTLRFPTTGTAPLDPGNYLQTAAHMAVSGPCSVLAGVTNYSYPGNGTAPFFPPTITSASPSYVQPGVPYTVNVAGHGLTPQSWLTFSSPGITAQTVSVTDTQLTAIIYAPSTTPQGPVYMYETAANLGDGDPRANFTSAPIVFNIGTGSGGGASTVTTSPVTGLPLTVDGIGCVSPCSFNWGTGTSHTIVTPALQSGGASTQYAFSNWSDGGAATHVVTVPGGTVYTAFYTKQYYLSTSASPAGAGIVNPPSGWYPSGSTVPVSATANTGGQFLRFTGDLSGTVSTQYVSKTAPRNVSGTFTAGATPNFSISATPSTQSVGQSGSATYSMAVNVASGFVGTIGFTTSGTPQGSTASFNPPTLSGSGTTVLTLGLAQVHQSEHTQSP